MRSMYTTIITVILRGGGGIIGVIGGGGIGLLYPWRVLLTLVVEQDARIIGIRDGMSSVMLILHLLIRLSINIMTVYITGTLFPSLHALEGQGGLISLVLLDGMKYSSPPICIGNQSAPLVLP